MRGTDPLGKVVSATADVKVPLIAPALSVTKTAAPPVVHGGDQVTWNVTVRNTGDSPLEAVTVTDDATPACSRAFGVLAPGAEHTHSCTANPSLTTTDTVTATGTDLSGQPVTAKSSATVTVIHPALAVTAKANPAVVREGDRVTFIVTVRNAGDVPLDDVAVADDTVPGCVRKFGTLAPNDVQTYQCEQLAPPDDVTNTVVATGKDQLGRAQRVTADARVDVVHPALAVTAVAAPAQVREGDQVTFTVTVRNSGDAEIHDVAVADDLVPGCARNLGTIAVQGKQEFTCTTVAGKNGFASNIAVKGTDPTGRSVAANASAAFTVQHPAVSLTATVQGGPFRERDSVPVKVVVANTGDVPLSGLAVTSIARAEGCAQQHDSLVPGTKWTFDCTTTAPGDDVTQALQVSAKPPVGPPVGAAAEAAIDVIHPAVTITQSAVPTVVRPGEPATFTMTVTNVGDVELHDTAIADPLVPECAKRLGTVAPQAKQTYTCTHPAADDVTSKATVTATDPSGRPVTAASSAQVDVIHPAVAITQTVAPAQVREGDQVTFTVTVRNSGDVPLTKASIVDERTAACARDFPALAVGAEQKYSCTAQAGHDGYTNTVKVSATDPLGGPVTASADAAYTVVHPGLALTKTVHGGPFRAGDPVTFTLTVTNTGDVPVTAVKVTDDGSCAKTFDTLAPSGKETYDCTVPAPADDAVSTARVTATPPAGPQLTASAEAKIDVIHPALTVRTNASPAVARVGDELTVTVVVTNTGDVPLTGVSSKDPGCVKAFDRLEAGAALTYQCMVKAAPDDFTITSVLTGNDPTNRSVTASGSAKVDVIHPQIAIMKDVEPYEVRQGEKVTFSLLVKNIGDVPLAGVSVVDDRTPACAHQVPALAPDAEETYQCTTIAGASGFTNTAKVTGTDPTQRTVDASAQATFVVKKPGLTVTKSAAGGPFRAGDPVPFEVVLTNAGDQKLRDVHVSDVRAPECTRTFAELPIGGIQRYPCIATAGDDASPATVTAAPPWGPPITAAARADFVVIHPAMELRRDHLQQPIRPGDPVTYLSTLRNIGDAPLHEVTVRDAEPACSFTLRTLAPGEQVTRACTLTARADTTTSTTASAIDQTGHPVTNGTTTTTDVTGPGLTVTTVGPPQPVVAGRATPVTATVTNTGDVPLTDVRAVGPGCASAPVDLAPGASAPGLTCAITAPGKVTATGRIAPGAKEVLDGGSETAGVGEGEANGGSHGLSGAAGVGERRGDGGLQGSGGAPGVGNGKVDGDLQGSSGAPGVGNGKVDGDLQGSSGAPGVGNGKVDGGSQGSRGATEVGESRVPAGSQSLSGTATGQSEADADPQHSGKVPAPSRQDASGVVAAEAPVRPMTTVPGVALVERADSVAAPENPVTFVVTAVNTGTAELSVAGHRLLPGERWEWTRTAIAPQEGQVTDAVAVNVEPLVIGVDPFTARAAATVRVGAGVDNTDDNTADNTAEPMPDTDLDLGTAGLAALALMGSGALLLRVTRRPAGH